MEDELQIGDHFMAGPSRVQRSESDASFRPNASSSPRADDRSKDIDLSDTSLSDIENDQNSADEAGVEEEPLQEETAGEGDSKELEDDDLSFSSQEVRNAEASQSPTVSQLNMSSQDDIEKEGEKESEVDDAGSETEKTLEKSTSAPRDATESTNALDLLPPELLELCTVGEEVVFTPDSDLDWRAPVFPWAMTKEGTVQFVIGKTFVGFPATHVLQKTVNNKTLVALTEEGKKVPPLLEAFLKLKAPEKLPIWETQLSKQRRDQFFWFLRTPNSTCGKALGDWSVGQDEGENEVKDAEFHEMTQAEAAQHRQREPPKNAVKVGKLPNPLKELVKGERPVRPVTPPMAFNLTGKRNSEAQGYHDAVYGGSKQISNWLD